MTQQIITSDQVLNLITTRDTDNKFQVMKIMQLLSYYPLLHMLQV